MNLWLIFMSILLIYFMIELLVLNYSKLNAFILIHCGF